MDGSVGPPHGAQEGTAWNGHFGCMCRHPLFVINRFGRLERRSLRPGNVHSADGRENVLKPVLARYADRELMRFFRADAAFAVPDIYKTPEAEGCSCAVRPGKTAVSESRIASVLKRPTGRPPTHVRRICGDFAYQAASRDKPSWDKPGGSSPGSNGIRVTCSRRSASQRSASWSPSCRWSRTGSFGSTTNAAPPNSMSRKEGGQSDASFLQGHGAERGTASASCIGLQSRCLAAGRRPACGPVSSGSERGSSATPEPSRSNRPGRLSAALCSPASLRPSNGSVRPGTGMTVSAIKPGGKRLDGSDPTGAGQIEFRFRSVAAAINRARFTNRMPEPRHGPPKRLDPYAKQRQHNRKGVLIGACRVNPA